MPYLGFPDIPLVGFWDDTQSFKIQPLELAITEGGLTSRGLRDRINRSMHSWRINGNIKNGLEVNSFLLERSTKPFAFSFDGTELSKKLYYCNDWKIALLGYVEDSNFQVWSFGATFKEANRAAIA